MSSTTLPAAPKETPAKKLRVVFAGITPPLPTFLERLAVGLSGRGHEVWVTAPPGTRLPASLRLAPQPTDWRSVHAAAQLFGALIKGGHHGRQVLRQAWASDHRRAAVRRLLPLLARRWDVIYFPWNEGAIQREPVFFLPTPVVLSCRGSQVQIAPHDPQRAHLPAALERTFRAASRVHCVSEAMLTTAETLGLDPQKAQVIVPAVDPHFFEPRDPSAGENPVSERHKLVGVGSLIWRKGWEDALVALSQAVDQGANVELEIVGAGPDRQRIAFAAHDLGIADRVRLTGQLAVEEIRARLQTADLFLHASLSEGISNAVLEAMACALPVIATDVDGTAEAIDHESNGLLVPAADPDAMGQAILRLTSAADASQLRQALGTRARQTICRRFSLDQQLDDFEGLLLSAASTCPAPDLPRNAAVAEPIRASAR